ncbi:MAG TPA: metallophosphoesterase [bacterium]|nr:metallophosphoesterase [bacterium]
MRILACADLHGRPERIARVRALVAEHAPAVVLLPGDLTHAGLGREALALLRDLPLHVLAVPGNMDAPPAAGEIWRCGGLRGTDPVTIGGTTFGGPAVTRTVDVLVVHEPPQGTLDRLPSGRHIGSAHTLELMTRLRPRVLTCGHVHESPGITRVGPTLVVNCTMGDGKTQGALIEITADEVSARLL